MSKSINTQNNSAHMGTRICIENDQSESGYIPGQRATMRYQEKRLVHNNDHKLCHTRH